MIAIYLNKCPLALKKCPHCVQNPERTRDEIAKLKLKGTLQEPYTFTVGRCPKGTLVQPQSAIQSTLHLVRFGF